MRTILSALMVVGLALSVSAGTISLIPDNNNPDPNEEVTVWVHTDTPLFALGLGVYVLGDANITTAMSESDCNQYGWDNGWNSDPYIDPNGYVYIGGIKWAGDANGTVGYFKFRFNRWQTRVYVDQENSSGIEFDWQSNVCGNSTFSTDVLVFGQPDPNEPNEPNEPNVPPHYWQKYFGKLPQLIHYSHPEPNIPPKAHQQEQFQFEEDSIGNGMQLDEEQNVIYVDSDITTNQIWTANNVYYVTAPIQVQSLLVIEPGTMVIFGTGYFENNCAIHVNNGGTLISKGTPDNPITYTCDVLYYYYPEDIGYYWLYLDYYEDWYYYCPIYIEKTASPSTTITYNFIEGAYYGIMTDNIKLEHPIENNKLFGNWYGIYENGTRHTDITNNLCFYSYESGIEVYLADTNSVGDGDSIINIVNNTCDDYQYIGIAVHGVEDENNAGAVILANNIVSQSGIYGLCLDGAMYSIITNMGYYGNARNKDDEEVEIEEDNPVQATTYPFDESGWHLVEGCPFINAGLQYAEETSLIGTTTNLDGIPDSNKIDIGYHYPNWDYAQNYEIAYWDFDESGTIGFGDLAVIADYWLEYFNFYDFADFARQWQRSIEEPNPDVTLNFDQDPNNLNGNVNVSFGVFDPNMCQMFVLIDGELCVKILYLDDLSTSIQTNKFLNGQHSFKVVRLEDNNSIKCSGPYNVTFNNSMQCVATNEAYDVGKPLHFCGYVQDGNQEVTVKAMDFEDNILWQNTYTVSNLNSYISQANTNTLDIDRLVFEESSEARGMMLMEEESSSPVTLSVTPSFDPNNVASGVRALIVTPDPLINEYNRPTQTTVRNAFGAHLGYYELRREQVTANNLEWFARNRNIQYIYFNGHGHYMDKKQNGTLRTMIFLGDGSVAFSYKQSDFNPGSIPSWCKKLRGNLETIGKSIHAMGFHTLKFVDLDSCYSGRLTFVGNNLVEGPRGSDGLALDVPNDMTEAFGITGQESFYQGWYDIYWNGYTSKYAQFSTNEWNHLRDGYTFDASFLYAISCDTQPDPHTGRLASENLRLIGRDLFFYLYGLQ